MARGKHGWNNTIESRLLIKGGNLAKLVPARRAASANPDMSTSDLHHSSPRARINRPLTPCKSLPCKLPWFGRVQAWKHCIQIKTHIHIRSTPIHTYCTHQLTPEVTHMHRQKPITSMLCPEDSHCGTDSKSEWDLSHRTGSGRVGGIHWMYPVQWVACPLQQSSLIMVGSASTGIELAANTIDNSHRLSCRRE